MEADTSFEPHVELDSFLPERGDFTPLDATRIDIPPPCAKRVPASHWIQFLDEDVKHHFTSAATLQQLFGDLVSDSARYHAPAAASTVSSRPGHYGRVLELAHDAGMLSWKAHRNNWDPTGTHPSPLIMRSFAVRKDEQRDRLISWPKHQNEHFPPPPNPELPNPSFWNNLLLRDCQPSAVYFDVTNMFHHILLPQAWWAFFPLTPIILSSLPPSLQQKLTQHLGQNLPQSTVVTPFQITLPMGFSWAVYVAQKFARGVLRQGLVVFRMSSACPHQNFRVLHASQCSYPVQVTAGDLILMHYIDDVNAVAMSWPDAALCALMRILSTLFQRFGLPFKKSKSSTPGTVERKYIRFIGFQWSFQHNTIAPLPNKLARAISDASTISRRKQATATQLSKVLGKLTWYSLPIRSLLSILHHLFSWVQQLPADSNERFTLSPACRRELEHAITLLPLSRLCPTVQFSTTVVAFDACLAGGAVVYTSASPPAILALVRLASLSSLPHPPKNVIEESRNRQYLSLLQHFVKSARWKIAVACRWEKSEHINGLEAATAVLALEWLASTKLQNHHALLLTDSAVVLGSLSKGRSSSPTLLVRCRRICAIALAHNLHPHLAYVPSQSNPADHPSRFALPPK